MRRRGLLICGAIVLVAHGAVFEAVEGHTLMTAGARASSGQRQADRLVLLDRRQVIMLTPPGTGAAAVLAEADLRTPVEAPSAVAAVTPPEADTPDAPAATAATANAELQARHRPSSTIYRSPAQLQQLPRMRSAPDTSMLNGLPLSGVPIRLRLFIDDQGTVVDIDVLDSAEAPEVIARVREMFLATGFTPGVEQGRPVPSYKDIEITVGAPP